MTSMASGVNADSEFSRLLSSLARIWRAQLGTELAT